MASSPVKTSDFCGLSCFQLEDYRQDLFIWRSRLACQCIHASLSRNHVVSDPSQVLISERDGRTTTDS